MFCENRYALDILQPLYEEALRQGRHKLLWYIHTSKIKSFRLDEGAEWTDSIQAVYDFSPEAIYVPGNIVPYYLPGVKIQVFHGYAAEKSDHWVIRRYFDTYLTQGPYFTSHFEALSRRYRDFEVRETGWTKQDWIRKHIHDYDDRKAQLLQEHGRSQVVLYAPTFSPKLTSLPYLKDALDRLLAERDILLLLKFHPLTKKEWCDEYREWAEGRDNAVYIEACENVTEYQMMGDVMISDTSSALYEFLLLDRPVVTFGAIAKDIYWENITDADDLTAAFDRAQNDPESISRRQWIIRNYDPHMDGKCCERMIAEAEDYIRRRGVPSRRRLNPWRIYTSIKTFGRIKRK